MNLDTCIEQNKNIRKVLDSEDFYYQKLKDLFEEFKQYHIGNEDIGKLIKKIEKKFKFEKFLSKNPEYTEFIELIGKIISIFDSKAYNKNIWNPYEDKRVVASAGVRQNIWVKGLLQYKLFKSLKEINSDSVSNAIAYIEDPAHNLTQLSTNHRKLVSQNILGELYDENSYFEKVKSYFSDVLKDLKIKNNSNIGRLLTDFLYCSEIKNYWYDNNKDENDKYNKTSKVEGLKQFNSLNKILYGPPGTGKTYYTINKALEIINGQVPNDRDEAKERFDELRDLGQIEFVTFHQSYGYEEFVEGIKPCNLDSCDDDQEIKYQVADGIFKKLSLLAKENYNDVTNTEVQKLKKKEEFKRKLEELKSEIEDNIDDDGQYPIGDTTTYIYQVEDNAFRYKGDKWGHNQRMKFEDLEKLYINNVKSRKEIKKLDEVSGLAKQHASYYLKMVQKLSDMSLNDKTIVEIDYKLKNFVLIIDEINRGNISKIFGELITLIEKSKRLGEDEQLEITLPYSNQTFGVPKNLYIIGTMNTADRSIALMDTALRRRFEFEEKMPDLSLLSNNDHKVENFDSNTKQDNDLIVSNVNIRLLLKTINERIEYLYDRDHTIGHSYFLSLKNEKEADRKAALDGIFKNRIIPLLQEYFYDDWEKIQMVLGDHIGQMTEKKIESEDKFYDPKNDTECLNKYRFIQSIKVAEKNIFRFNHDDIEDQQITYKVNDYFEVLAYIKIYEDKKAEFTRKINPSIDENGSDQ